MRQIIDAFSTLFVLMLCIFACIAVGTFSVQAAEAKEYKADVIAVIENSNFNPNVIAGCKAQASAAGYDLEVKSILYDENSNRQVSEVTLTYDCRIPVFGLHGTRTTRGIAR